MTEDRHKEKISGEKLATFLKEEHFRQLFFTSIKQGPTERDSKNYVNSTLKINRYHEYENEMFVSNWLRAWKWAEQKKGRHGEIQAVSGFSRLLTDKEISIPLLSVTK